MKEKHIVCLGDSLVEGWGVAREACWVSLLGRETPCRWTNAGVSGDTVPGMLARLETAVLARQPDYALLLGGLNDITVTGSAAAAESAVMAIVHQCVHRGVRPVVGIPWPVTALPPDWTAFCGEARATAVYAEYIGWLRTLGTALRLRCVDFAAAFRDAGPEALLPDGVHPSAAGHRRMAEAVKQSGFFA